MSKLLLSAIAFATTLPILAMDRPSQINPNNDLIDQVRKINPGDSLDAIQELLRAKADANTVTQDHGTLLELAATKNYPELMQLLIKYKGHAAQAEKQEPLYIPVPSGRNCWTAGLDVDWLRSLADESEVESASKKPKNSDEPSNSDDNQ